jgi:hypothetical protein
MMSKVTALVENDISRTLPVLARIERMGAWVGPPQGFTDWEALFASTENDLRQYETDAGRLSRLGVDIYSASYNQLVDALKSGLKVRLPAGRWSPDLIDRQRFDRYVDIGVKEAVAVKNVRSLTSLIGSYFWQRQIAVSPERLQGGG